MVLAFAVAFFEGLHAAPGVSGETHAATMQLPPRPLLLSPSPQNDATLTNRALDSLACRRRVLLSGTPLQNRLDEFYGGLHC